MVKKINYWLMKSEPVVYSIDDLQRDGTTCWEGVRNYQARNFLRDEIKCGDKALFYHSNAKPPGVAGIATVIREGYPDHTALDPDSKYFDPRHKKDNPVWYMVDIAFEEKFPRIISLDELKSHPELRDMPVVQRGMRLSVQPVSRKQFQIVREMVD